MWGFQQGFQWWMPLFGMGMMVFWVVIIGVAVWGFSRLIGGRGGRSDYSETPIEILRARLAHGEITSEQFEELQDSLLGRIRNA